MDENNAPLELTATVLQVGGRGWESCGHLARAWRLEVFDFPGFPEEGDFGGMNLRRATALRGGAAERTETSPTRADVRAIARAADGLVTRGTGTDVRGFDGMSNIPETPVIAGFDPWTCLHLDVEWKWFGRSRSVRHRVRYYHMWGILGSDANAFRDVVFAILRCCGDDGDTLRLGINHDRIPPPWWKPT